MQKFIGLVQAAVSCIESTFGGLWNVLGSPVRVDN